MKRRNFIFGLGGLLSFFCLHKTNTYIEAKENDLPIVEESNAYKIWYNKDILHNFLYGSLRQNFSQGIWYKKRYWTVSTSIDIKKKYLDENRVDIVQRGFDVLSCNLINLVKDGEFNSFGTIFICYEDSDEKSKIIIGLDVQKDI